MPPSPSWAGTTRSSFDTRAAVSTLFELQGEACARSSALDRVVAFALGRELDGDTAVVLPAIGRTDAPVTGRRRCADSRPSARAVVPGGRVDRRRRHRSKCAAVDRDRSRPRPGRGARRGRAATTPSRSDWDAGVQLAQLALAHELVGVSRPRAGDGTRARARAHPVRPADRQVPGGAAPTRRDARGHRDRGRGARRRLARPHAGHRGDGQGQRRSQRARVAAKHCQQVLAGIGFTTEHDLHRYLRRIWMLDQLFGSSAVLTKHLGEQLMSTRTLPPLLPL